MCVSPFLVGFGWEILWLLMLPSRHIPDSYITYRCQEQFFKYPPPTWLSSRLT